MATKVPRWYVHFICIAFAGYGFYCILSRTAYMIGETPLSEWDVRTLVMTGHHAVVFGLSLIAFAAVFGLPERILAKSGFTPARVRFVGLCVFVVGVTYAWAFGSSPLSQG